MRVSDNMMWSNVQRGVASRQQAYQEAQEKAISGKKVNVPSDDPAAFAQGRTETGNIARAESYERTIGQTRPVLQQTEDALYHSEDIVQRIRQIAVQGASDTYNASDRASMVQELSGLATQLVSIGNTTNGERFIFGGYKDGTQPYDAAGMYSGDPQTAQVEISRGVTMAYGVTGEQVFGTAGNDVFTTIANLQAALTSGDGNAISDTITDIDSRYEQLRAVHSEVGIHLNALDISEAVVTKAKDAATDRRSSLIDIDMAQSYSDLMRAQSALAAAINIAAQLPPPGLASRGG
jgi:flagellar hook-associated protein 3 FlgL